MFRNYFKTAWRSLWKSRFYSSLNILGLAIGLASGILILLWVQDELSFDGFHRRAPDIYQVVTHIGSGNGAQAWYSSPPPVALTGKKKIPGVEDAVRIVEINQHTVYRYKVKELMDARSACIDNSLFSVFDFTLLRGDPASPFPDDHSILLSESFAGRFFGKEDPIGKTIVADNKDSYTVKGIFRDMPANSGIRLDMLFPIHLLAGLYDGKGYWKSMDEDWGNYYCNTYLLLHAGTRLQSVEKMLTDQLRRHFTSDQSTFFTLRELKKTHLTGADGSSAALLMVRIFLLAALFILIIACINYVNLSTARSVLRAKEVSLRKIIGAARVQLFIQFMLESAILFLIAAAVALLFIRLLLPLYDHLTGKQISFSLLDHNIWSTLGLTLAACMLASGIYPALLLSSFRPIQSLRGKLLFGLGNNAFRKILVVTQFTFSIALIVGTLIIGRQLNYIRTKQLGYDRSNVFSFGLRDMKSHEDAVKGELQGSPGISGVSFSDGDILNNGNGTTGDTYWEGKEVNRSFLVAQIGVDRNFIPLMKLKMTEGNNFSGSPADSSHYILNETAVREAGIKDPVGKLFSLHDVKGTIIGVIKDFHFQSLREKIQPAVFYYLRAGQTMYVRTAPGEEGKAIKAVEKCWKTYNPGFPFDYKFLDEGFDDLYKSDQRTGALLNLFAAIAILISCLGLFGLATYSAQARIKEIGIRKVLGAGTARLASLLTRDFIRPVFLSMVIACPISWWATSKWLDDYAYRVPIHWEIFALAALLTVAIALATVSFQAIRAALANPVKNLRSE